MDQNQSKLIIANKALYKIGAKRLSSLDDGSPNSILINDIYPSCLIELLEEHPWSFAVQTVSMTQLALLTALPVMNDGVDVAYACPADFLNIYLLSTPAIYRVETIKPPYVAAPIVAILSDVSNMAAMKYVFVNDDPTSYTAKFINALSTKLALDLCFKISEAASMSAAMETKYQKDLLSAISADSNSSTPDQAIADEWFIARLAGSSNNNLAPWGITASSPTPEPF